MLFDSRTDMMYCFFFFNKSAVRTTDLMVETQLCKLRGTSDTFVGRIYSILHLEYVLCELNVRYDY